MLFLFHLLKTFFILYVSKGLLSFALFDLLFGSDSYFKPWNHCVSLFHSTHCTGKFTLIPWLFNQCLLCHWTVRSMKIATGSFFLSFPLPMPAHRQYSKTICEICMKDLHFRMSSRYNLKLAISDIIGKLSNLHIHVLNISKF